jgi:hypothetical protein
VAAPANGCVVFVMLSMRSQKAFVSSGTPSLERAPSPIYSLACKHRQCASIEAGDVRGSSSHEASCVARNAFECVEGQKMVEVRCTELMMETQQEPSSSGVVGRFSPFFVPSFLPLSFWKSTILSFTFLFFFFS